MESDLSSYSPALVSLARKLPKVELHLHLDGSLSPAFIQRMAESRGINLPTSPENLREFLMDKKLEALKTDNRAKAGGNWPVFDFCNQFLQTATELKLATLDLLERLAAEGVVYAEIRFCPELHTREGLTEEEVIASVLGGAREQTEVVTGIILVALRSKSAEHGERTVNLAHRFLQLSKDEPFGVVGVDIAGDEGSFPLKSDGDPMAGVVRKAAQLGIPVTVHAGEWPERFGSVANLAWALQAPGVKRIGHAIAIRSSPEAVDILKEKDITVEVCLTSNIGNGFKVANYSQHPVKILQEMGGRYSLSSDNLLLSGDKTFAPSPTTELLHLALDANLGWSAVRQSIEAGLRAAFSPKVDKTFLEETEKTLDELLEKMV